MNRDDTLVALGGGVIGDIAGFAAAVYKRGISFVQAPTTLLAMVDSSVGGKVAVNLPGGKNMAGAFYQPEAVFADVRVLDTLDSRQYAAGMAEVIKYGYIADNRLLEKLKRNEYEIESVIYDCCSIKAAYVEEDPYDKGIRMQLNYGHTIGHAIETAAGYGKYLHGEAVAVGMLAAARMGERLGISPAGLADETAGLLKQYGLPHTLDRALLAKAADTIARDKKAAGGKVDFVLIDKPGHATTKKLDIETITEYMTGQKSL
jgi:3-dehydroquinate synthase